MKFVGMVKFALFNYGWSQESVVKIEVTSQLVSKSLHTPSYEFELDGRFGRASFSSSDAVVSEVSGI